MREQRGERTVRLRGGVLGIPSSGENIRARMSKSSDVVT